MTTAVYVRVSTRSQDLASQIPDLERYVSTLDGEAKWFRDKFTGKTMERPQWSKLMADVAAGKVARLVVWRLDRLGRTAKGLTSLFEELQSRKVNLVSLRDGLDLSTPAGRLMANMMASVGQYEREVIQERTHAGLEVAREKGKTLGRPAVGAGNGRRHTVTDEQVEQVTRLKAEKTSVAAIARATGLSRPTVYQILNTSGSTS